AGEGQVIPQLQQLARHFDAARIAVVHAGHVRIAPRDLQTVRVRVAVVHDDRLAQIARQLHLPREYNLLPRAGALVLFPIVVQPDLPDRAHLGLIAGQPADVRQLLFPAVRDILRVDADGRIDKGILTRIADRLA